jgi:hypothetical protein
MESLTKRLRAAALFLALTCTAGAQNAVIPPIDNVLIDDPRILDLTGDGYQLVGSKYLVDFSVVQDSRGYLIGSAQVDDGTTIPEPVAVTGRLSVDGSRGLKLALAGGEGNTTRPAISINGRSDGRIFTVTVKVKGALGKETFNENFAPVNEERGAFIGEPIEPLSLPVAAIASNKGSCVTTSSRIAELPAEDVAVFATESYKKNAFTFGAAGRSFSTEVKGSFGPSGYTVGRCKVKVGYGCLTVQPALVFLNEEIPTDE